MKGLSLIYADRKIGSDIRYRNHTRIYTDFMLKKAMEGKYDVS